MGAVGFGEALQARVDAGLARSRVFRVEGSFFALGYASCPLQDEGVAAGETGVFGGAVAGFAGRVTRFAQVVVAVLI